MSVVRMTISGICLRNSDIVDFMLCSVDLRFMAFRMRSELCWMGMSRYLQIFGSSRIVRISSGVISSS